MMRLVLVSALVALACAAPQILRPRLDGRIVGGEDTTIEEYPYQISLLWRNSHICGGSIISSRYVVTAAHCTDGDQPSALQIRAGSTIRNNGGVVVQVQEIHQNPQYDSFEIDYDITVLHLAEDLDLSQAAIGAVGLPTPNQAIEDGAEAVCTGWGSLREGGSPPDILQTVTVYMVPNNRCNAAYGGGITDRMNCAGIENVGGKDACQGDSGGPLVVDGQLVGIVSWGYGCARPEYPGVYSSVPALRPYITEVSGI